MYRQGDVLIISVNAVPTTAEAEEAGPRTVLARGEATGHAHVLEAEELVSYRHGDDRYFAVAREAVLRHEEHGAIRIPPGSYRVVIQREYVPRDDDWVIQRARD